LTELKFVPTRAAISILLRDLVRIGAEMDTARGLPVIHANFVGYDEQAHRRGPTSAFAHWSLRGIDDAVSRLWKAAKRSGCREYDVWIYSDHGQEETQPYSRAFGRTVEQAIAQVLDGLREHTEAGPNGLRGIESLRVRLLGGNKSARLFPAYRQAPPVGRAELVVVAMGPLGFIYAPGALTTERRAEAARRLVSECGIPLVLAADGPDGAVAWTKAGEHLLPDDGGDVLGVDHPFLDEAVQDMIALCGHPDAGDLVICGWSKDGSSYSFPLEHGAHAGPGREETRGFALLPPDIPLPELARPYLRPLDLRQAALTLLDRLPWRPAKSPEVGPGGARRRDGVLRVMTYNVHSCMGMDGRTSPERVARVIAQYEPDIVCLQELDVGRLRTAGVDQAQAIAHRLEMEYHFHATLHVAEEQYGDAILTHLPMELVQAGTLPGLPQYQPRGALWVTVDAYGTQLQVINTHLSLWPRERRLQVAALAEEEWLGSPKCQSPAILLGDLNAGPNSTVCQVFRGRLRDAQHALPGHRPQRTFFGRLPSTRIDHIFVDPAFEVLTAEVPRTELARVASDHLPLIADLRVRR
jgi:endonuclease/exonuclease/phosphatase family metal-dependent hydrolase